MKRWALSRRALLEGAAASWLAACGGSQRPPGEASSLRSERDAPFSVWHEIQQALRASPDHVPARAAQLVAAKDAQGLFRLVREQIATHPAQSESFGDWDVTQRWGARGALRAAAGTPRDKAELLAQLLRRAGFDDAGVVAVERELTPQKERELLCQAHARRFEPKVSKAVGQQWLRRLGIASTPKLEAPLDQDGKLAMKLADNVLATFAEPPQAKAYAFGGKGLLPAVRATLQGKPHLFDLFGDKPAVTPSDEGTKPKTRRLQKVHVSLQARIATDGKASAPIELVRGSWTVADLVGRRLRLQMLPTLKIAQALRAPIADLMSFMPSISLEGPDVDRTLAQQRSVAGDVISLTGRRLRVKYGSLHIDGHELKTEPRAVERVASLQVTADASRFPLVQLSVRALDAAGKPVSGLGGALFSVTDDGRARTALVTRGPEQDAADQEGAAYRFEYLALSGDSKSAAATGGGVRNVSVQLQCKMLQGKASYRLPTKRVLPRMLCSLEMVVRSGGGRKLTRRIAGWDASRPDRPLKEAIAETRGALLGSHLLQIEGPSPPTSVLLDGVVTELLALEPVAEALAAGDDAVLQLMADGMPIRPPHQLALAGAQLPQRADGNMLTYEIMPRMVLVSEYIAIGSNKRLTRIDQLPLHNLRTVGSDGQMVFRRTLTNSAGLAIAESALGQLSSYGKLGTGPLLPLNKKALAGMAAEQKAYWSWAYAAARKRSLSLLAAAKSEPGDPYYAVDGQGQLFALLADGSGGAEAVEQIRKTLKEIEEVMDAIALLGTAANLSPALGVVMIHGRLLVRLYTAVAIAITMMDNSGVDEAVRQTLASAACDVLKLAGTALFGRTISMAFAGLDYIIGAFAAKLGQRNPFSCW